MVIPLKYFMGGSSLPIFNGKWIATKSRGGTGSFLANKITHQTISMEEVNES